MGNAASRNEIGKTQRTPVEEEVVVDEKQQLLQQQKVITESLDKNVVRQTSTWSLGSLSERFNWSFTGTTRSSFRNRNKSTRKSLTTQQQRNCRAKTVWHKPLTNAIFSSHFKLSCRNEQFHIEQLVAKGAFGVVFKVIDKENSVQQQQQRPQLLFGDNVVAKPAVKTARPPRLVYALKVIKKSKIIEENSVQQIKDEADIQQICGHHPFIVQQLGLWQNRRNLHILSEYVPNGELFSKITKFSVDLTRLYLAEIALGIDFLHNAGVIYRDAKPENILLTETFHIKLTDFGLSKWLKLGATTKTMCGTFQYMAPEIIRGEAYGHAVDWWSLGIIACQMFTQKAPNINQFLGITLPNQQPDSKDELDRQSVKETSTFQTTSLASNQSQNFLPPEVDDLPHAASDVLRRLLHLDPKQRPFGVLGLQKIALYMNFKLNAKHLLTICPLKIIARDGLTLSSNMSNDECDSSMATTAFQGF